MIEINDKFEELPIPLNRRIVKDVQREGKKKNTAYGMGEVDVEVPRQMMKKLKEKNGENISFTAYLLWCLAKALDEHRELHAVTKGKNVVIFDNVDVSTMVERDSPDGHKVPVTMVIRGANKKTFQQINDEIRGAQKSEFTGSSLEKSKEAKQASSFAKMPGFIRNIVWFKVRHDPIFRKKMLGTAIITAVGMFGVHGGYAHTDCLWPFALYVGGITRKPVAVNEQVVIHDILSITIGVDHDAVDGGPATRFAVRLIDLIESGSCLPQIPK
jgi:pyruvate/2-oxoglutarate dehydrogenase complex dihydrolipoamide acyltransferase (E2) component